MSNPFASNRYLNRRSKQPRECDHAFLETLENEGIIAPPTRASRTITQRESTFNGQRCIPRTSAPGSWEQAEDLHSQPRASSALSQTPTVAQSVASKSSMKGSGIFRAFHRKSNHNVSSHGGSSGKKEEVEVDQPKPKRGFFDSFRSPHGKRTAVLCPRTLEYEWTGSASEFIQPSASYLHLPAPAPIFGEVPGAGLEKPKPRVDLSSGAAARAAAAAQNELMESMRKLDLRGHDEVQDSESGIGIESGESKVIFSIPVIRKDPAVILPPEIVSGVFTYLSAESMICCELVSKSWHAIASTQHAWKRVFQSEVKAPEHRRFTDCHNMDEDVYPDVTWKRRWQTHKALSSRWSRGIAGAYYLEGHSDNIYCVQFDDEKIVTGSKDRTVRIWSTRDIKCMNVLGVPNRRFNPTEMENLPDDASPAPLTRRISSSRDGGDIEELPMAHEGSILCLQYDKRILVTGSSDGTLIVWNKISTFGFSPIQRLREHSKGVLDLCFNENHIVSCSKDHEICLWARDTGYLLRKLTGHRGPVNAVRMKGDLIASASGDGLVKLWNLTSGLCIKEFSSSSRGLACVELSCDSRVIWAGGNDHEIYEFDANTGMLANRLGAHSDLVRSLHLDEHSGRLVSGSYDHNIKIINTHNQNETMILKRWSASWILSAKADYRRIVATSQDKRIIVIDFGYQLDGINALDPGSYC